jgi:DNA polymerase-3 subunit delta'
MENNYFSHAIILEGKKQTSEFAESIAIKIMGENDSKKIKKRIHPDITYLPMENKRKSIGTDEIRFVRKDAISKPVESNSKIYIIENSQNLTVQAQNAFLKILEEPPENVIFILSCPNAQQFLPALLSRAEVIRTENFPNSELRKNKHTELLENKAKELASAIMSGEKFKILSSCAHLLRKRDDFKFVLEKSRFIIIKKCKKNYNISKLIKIANTLRKAVDLINSNVNANLVSCFLAEF